MENVVQIEVWNGARLAIITANDACGPFTTRLYVNHGQTATTMVRKATTLKGARKQAAGLLAA